jgi:hypothetical protein
LRESAEVKTCEWCGVHHVGACPRIKSLEFRGDGTIKRVEFHEPKIITGCEHANKIDFSTMGHRAWQCKDCGEMFEEQLT